MIAIDNQTYSISSIKHVNVVDNQKYLIRSLGYTVVIDNQIIILWVDMMLLYWNKDNLLSTIDHNDVIGYQQVDSQCSSCHDT